MLGSVVDVWLNTFVGYRRLLEEIIVTRGDSTSSDGSAVRSRGLLSSNREPAILAVVRLHKWLALNRWKLLKMNGPGAHLAVEIIRFGNDLVLERF